MQLNNVVHRASALKQQNKKHNKLGHRTKGQLASLVKGNYLKYLIRCLY